MVEWLVTFAIALTFYWVVDRLYGIEKLLKNTVIAVEKSWEFIKGVFIK